jgi:hypothetical protein
MNDNLDTFNSIKRLIEKLEYSYDAEYMPEVTNHLLNQFEIAGSAEWSMSDLKDYIFDNDIADLISCQGYVIHDDFLQDIREIQHAIIMFFGD